MRKRSYVWVMAAVLAFGGTVYAEDATVQTSAEAMTEAGAEAVQSDGLSEKWSDFQIQIDGTVYQFPMTYEDWMALGWTARDETDGILEPYQYGMLRYQNGERQCTAFVLNLGINNEPVDKCIVAGISIDNFDWDLTAGEVVLPGGLVRGQTTVEEIQAAYGTPSDTYEGDLYTQVTYETDYNSSVELTVYKESGVLEDVEVRNFVEPEGFVRGEVSEEIPAEVTSYEKPEAFSEDAAAYEIELDGQVYALPVPVSVLIADGWELNPSDTEEMIMAKNSGWAGLIKGGQSFRTMVRNEAEYATIPENCWVEELEVGGYSLEMDGALPGGIRIGTTEEEFLAILDAEGMEYTVEESGDFRYYTYNELAYDQCCETIVYTAADGSFAQNTVIEVSCSNTFE